MLFSVRALIAGVGLVLVASVASAAPISMSPDPVGLPSIDGTPDAFTLSLTSGDTDTNRLDFRLQGPGGGRFLPTVGASVIVFDDVTLTDVGTSSVTSMLFLGPEAFDDDSAAGWLAFDWRNAGSAEFFVVGDGEFSSATVYSLGVDLRSIRCKDDFDINVIDRKVVHFSSAVPEPSAALVFCVGMVITGRSLARRRAA